MAALSQLTLDADGVIGSKVVHEGGAGAPFYTHCQDTPDGGSSDWVSNDQSEGDTEAWFRLTDVNADFGSMDSLNIDVDVDEIDDGTSNDLCTLVAQIFDSNSGGTENPLTDAQQIADETDTTRLQRQLPFGSLTGSKSQWNNAYLKLTWDYTKPQSGDNVQVRLWGCDIDGVYTISTGGIMTQLQGANLGCDLYNGVII